MYLHLQDISTHEESTSLFGAKCASASAAGAPCSCGSPMTTKVVTRDGLSLLHPVKQPTQTGAARALGHPVGTGPLPPKSWRSSWTGGVACSSEVLLRVDEVIPCHHRPR